jgi:Spy/CpxP family protein refolding chaperone
MISKFKFNMVAVFILALGVFAGAALAQDTTTTPKQDNTQKQDKFERRGQFGRRGGEGFRGGPGGPMGMLRMFHDLNLTDAQKEQIHTILESNKPDQAQMQQQMDQMKAIREARKNGTELTADQKAQLKAFREAQRANMESVHEQIMNVLTPEQKQQLETKRQEMQKKWQDHQQFRKPGAPGTDKPATDKPATKPTSN